MSQEMQQEFPQEMWCQQGAGRRAQSGDLHTGPVVLLVQAGQALTLAPPVGPDLSGAGIVPDGDRECPANAGHGCRGFLLRHAVAAAPWQRPSTATTGYRH